MQATLYDGAEGLVVQIPDSLATQAGLQAGMAIDIVLPNGQLVIMPEEQSLANIPVDPIFGLGQTPVVCNLLDAAEHHDRHIYDANQR